VPLGGDPVWRATGETLPLVGETGATEARSCSVDSGDGRVLEMRAACERCATTLDGGSAALICSYECTFCGPCGVAMEHVCPNCGGELVTRPRRAAPA
jgi:uncharacterized protein